MRLYCHIQLAEVAAVAKITPQRLSQFESRRFNTKPKDPERLINALETVIEQRLNELKKIEYICKHERETIFNYIKGGEGL